MSGRQILSVTLPWVTKSKTESFKFRRRIRQLPSQYEIPVHSTRNGAAGRRGQWIISSRMRIFYMVLRYLALQAISVATKHQHAWQTPSTPPPARRLWSVARAERATS